MSEARVITPTDNQPDLATVLREDHADLLERRDQLLSSLERAPETIEDENVCGKVNDFIKQIDAAKKRAEALRKDAKEPILQSGRLVDGFFKGVIDPLDKAKKTLNARVTTFLRAKAEAERKRREEEERKAREEAARLQKEAEERATNLANDDDLDGAISAEESAKQAQADADRRAREADANAAEMSRTRSERGSVGSLRTEWKHDESSLDRAALDLETLRPHIPDSALHQAVRSYVRAGGRDLRGVRIYEDHVAVVR